MADTLPGYQLPSQLVRDEEIDRIDRHCRAFIRIDSLRKVAVSPRVALMFRVPGIEETLRVFGTASIVDPGCRA
jgi:hypothetical protein